MTDQQTIARPLNPADEAVARWLAEREPELAEELRTAALVLTLAQREGHTAYSFSAMSPQFAETLTGHGIEIPNPQAFRSALAGSRLVGSPGEPSPLILDGDLLSFRRFHQGERSIAASVSARLVSSQEEADLPVTESLKSRFKSLFPGSTGDIDWQAVAAAAALRTRFLCIAGGPGTGKTTTVTRLIALLLAHDPDMRISLAAPTGKAANRMAESILDQVARLTLSEDERGRIPTSASTLHRLLGYSPTRARFSYGKDRKLEADVVIVDEASMIDHEMFSALLDALDNRTRLILLGDPDQLPSVESGFVFGSICGAAAGEAKTPTFVNYLEDLGIAPAPAVSSQATALNDAVITLRRGHRFGPDSGIGTLAYALRDGRQDDIRHVLTGEAFSDIDLFSHDDQKRVVRTAVRELARTLVGAGSAGEALAALDSVRVLSPVRIGSRGVEALNEDLEAYLVDEGVRPPGRDYRGKPILINTNDYEVSLFNGDVGVLWDSPDGRLEGCFAGPDGIRRVALSRLPAHEVAWVMTVHKSQGSEFDKVVIVLPDREDAGRLTRELLYTAVTRARRRITVVGDAEVVVEGAVRQEERVTGLSGMLDWPGA